MSQVHWTFTGCDDTQEAAVVQQWQQRQLELEAKINSLELEPSELRLAVEHQADSPAWQMHAALHLPLKTLVAEGAADDFPPVVEAVIDGLSGEIDRLELPSTEPAAVRREGLHAVVPFLERFHAAGRSDSFLAFLAPLLRPMRRHVRRELRVMRIEGAVPEEQITPADIMDEILVRAWERFGKRPKDKSLDVWVLQLVHEALQDAIRGQIQQSLEDRVPFPYEESQEYWLNQWTDNVGLPESTSLRELLPGHPAADDWDRLDIETKSVSLGELLSLLPWEQRQALVLSAVEGYEPATVADIQDRPIEQVEADLAAARQTLSHNLEVEGFLPEIEHRIEEPGGRDTRRRRR